MPDLDDADERARFWQSLRPLISELTPDAVKRDGGAYLDYLAGVVPGKAAITGYCMGARAGWRIAAAYPDRVAAVASFHAGGLVTDAPDSPHLSADQLTAELYFGHADEDQSMTPDQIEALERVLDEVGARYRSELYAGA